MSKRPKRHNKQRRLKLDCLPLEVKGSEIKRKKLKQHTIYTSPADTSFRFWVYRRSDEDLNLVHQGYGPKGRGRTGALEMARAWINQQQSQTSKPNRPQLKEAA